MAGSPVPASPEVTILSMKVGDIIKLLERDGWFRETRDGHPGPSAEAEDTSVSQV
jgi:hypothetical protein